MLLNQSLSQQNLEITDITVPGEHISDDNLIQRVIKGDINAYGSIMRRYNQKLFRVARSIVKNDADALDIVQEAHIKAFTKIKAFRGDSTFSAWLAGITRNEALMHLRKYKREVTMQENEIDIVDISDRENSTQKRSHASHNPESCLENKELKVLLNNSIDLLPDNFRTVFVLRAVEQFSLRETAEILDINPQTVKSRLFRARQLLRAQIQSSLETSSDQIYQVGGVHCDNIVRNVMYRLQQISNQ